MTDLAKRVANAKSALQQIKTTQRSQNDSYKFYRYRSENLYFDSGSRTYKVTFSPLAKHDTQVICNFRIMNYTFPAASSSQISANVEDPLSASCLIVGLGSYSWSDAQKRIYVTVVSNCEGVLTVTQE